MFDYKFIEMLEIIKLIRDFEVNKNVDEDKKLHYKNKILNYQYKNPYFGKIYIGADKGGLVYINVYSTFFTYYIKWYRNYYYI